MWRLLHHNPISPEREIWRIKMALPVFAVTFRIAKTTAEQKGDYDERYKAIVDVIRSFADSLF
jgi:hypothetical protein